MKKNAIYAVVILVSVIVIAASLLAFIRTDSMLYGGILVGAVAALMAAIALLMEGEPYDYRFNA